MSNVPSPVKSRKLSTLLTIPPSMELALTRMNEEFCIVDALAGVVAIPTEADPKLRVYSRADITQIICADRIVEGQPVPPRWFSSPTRNRVKDLTYAPGQPRYFDNLLNTWIPSPIKPSPGDLSLFFSYLDHIFTSDATYRPWFTAWLAYQFQHPGVKLHSAVVFWSSETGTGKSFFGYLMASLFGQHNFAEINEGELHEKFNFWADRRQFVMGEEIKGSNSQRQADYLKSLITRRYVHINLKQTKQFSLPDCINYFFTSNHAEAFHLDSSDRRFFVHELAPRKLDAHYVKTTLTPWLEAGGYSAILHYLKHEVDLSLPVLDGKPFNPYAAAPQTLARSAMIDASREEHEVWLDDFKESPEPGYGLASADELYFLFTASQPRTRITPKAFANACAKRFPRAYDGNALRCSDGKRRRLFIIGKMWDTLSHKMRDGVSLNTQYDAEVTDRCVTPK
jgi:hypothetical protein